MFTSVASNIYAVIIVGNVDAGHVRKHYISPLSTPQCRRSRACSLRRWRSLGNGSRRNGLRASSPNDSDELLKQTDPNPLQYSNVDSTLWMMLYGPSRTRWRSSRAVVTLRSSVPVLLYVRPSSLHWLHSRITVVAAWPVRAQCHGITNQLPGDQPFRPVR